MYLWIIYVSMYHIYIYIYDIYDIYIYIYSIKMDGLVIWDLKPLKNTLIFFLHNMWRWEGLNVAPHRMSTGGVVRMHMYVYIYIHIICIYI